MKHETIGNYYKRAGEICPVCFGVFSEYVEKFPNTIEIPYFNYNHFVNKSHFGATLDGGEITKEAKEMCLKITYCPNCLGMGYVINTSKTYEEIE